MDSISSEVIKKSQDTRTDMEDPAKGDVHKENREYKNSVFVDLFFLDETARDNLLSLYNAIYGAELTDPEAIYRLRVDDVLYKNFKNDISFEVEGQLFIFGEHQSSLNKNMPLRCLMYTGRAYEQLVDTKSRYKENLIRIPTPQFFVFYNGTKEAPMEEELKLSSAFLVPQEENCLELTVRVININTKKGHEILKKCKVLREYSQFVDAVRRHQSGNDPEPVKQAIRECIKNNILAEYLKRKGSEVVNMLVAEYDYEMDICVKQEEAREEGIKIGMEAGMKAGMEAGMKAGKEAGMKAGMEAGMILSIRRMWAKNHSAGMIADTLDEPLESVEHLCFLFQSHPDWTEEEILEELHKERTE